MNLRRGRTEGACGPRAPLLGLPDLPGTDPASVAAFRAMLGLMRRHRQLMSQVLSGRDLHPGQAGCLGVLLTHGELSQSDLAEHLAISRPGVTRLLQRLERAGLVNRRSDPHDQRQALVTLTPTGRDLALCLPTAVREYIDHTLALLPAEDVRELTRILGALTTRIDEALAGPVDEALAGPAVPTSTVPRMNPT